MITTKMYKMLSPIYSGLSAKNKSRALYVYKQVLYLDKNIFGSLCSIFAAIFAKNSKIKNLNNFEQRFYSQNGEDGIICAIFRKIKTTNKFCIEFGIHPNEGNTIRLKKKNWNCLWMDGNGDGKIIKKEYITAENINRIFKKYKVPRKPDLLSIDIDSNDYWIWKAIEGYSPRVVIIEYNASIPMNESKTIKYDVKASWNHDNYFGASLLALRKLGESKGYTLIACDSMTINAFFVRNDLAKKHFVIRPFEEIYRPPQYGEKINGVRVGHPKSRRKMISV